MVYKYSNTPLLPQFMSDPAVNAMRKEREEQTVQLTALLRTAAPSIDSASVRASVTCGTLDVQCKRARAAANSEYTRLRKELKERRDTPGLPRQSTHDVESIASSLAVSVVTANESLPGGEDGGGEDACEDGEEPAWLTEAAELA